MCTATAAPAPAPFPPLLLLLPPSGYRLPLGTFAQCCAYDIVIAAPPPSAGPQPLLYRISLPWPSSAVAVLKMTNGSCGSGQRSHTEKPTKPHPSVRPAWIASHRIASHRIGPWPLFRSCRRCRCPRRSSFVCRVTSQTSDPHRPTDRSSTSSSTTSSSSSIDKGVPGWGGGEPFSVRAPFGSFWPRFPVR